MRSLQWWRDPILNYLDDRQTNAFAEGITNKINAIVIRDPFEASRVGGRQHRQQSGSL